MTNTANLTITTSSQPAAIAIATLSGVGTAPMTRQFATEDALRDWSMKASAAGAARGVAVVIRDERRRAARLADVFAATADDEAF